MFNIQLHTRFNLQMFISHLFYIMLNKCLFLMSGCVMLFISPVATCSRDADQKGV